MHPAPFAGLHALDAVRSLALILGVVFHASLSFLPGPVLWVAVDSDRSTALALLFFVLHMFRMTVFFVMAGFFGRLLLERRGTRGFVRDRLKRIALPLVISWPLLLAAIVAVTWWAPSLKGDAVSTTPPLPTEPGAFSLAHLWFLYLLLWLYAAAMLLRAVLDAVDPQGHSERAIDRVLRATLHNPLVAVALAAPLWAVFAFGPPWSQWVGVPAPDTSLIPNPAAITAYGIAFALGWWLQRQPELMHHWERRWPLHLALAVACTLAALGLAGPASSFALASAPSTIRTAIAACYAVAMWSWSFALIGLALRYLSGYSAWRRYLADASYWLYLIHLPLVMALQVAVTRLPGPWWIKFPLILSIAFPLMLSSYQLMVRGTWLGALLNGHRLPRPFTSNTAPGQL